jgi:hypothetical protein
LIALNANISISPWPTTRKSSSTLRNFEPGDFQLVDKLPILLISFCAEKLIQSPFAKPQPISARQSWSPHQSNGWLRSWSCSSPLLSLAPGKVQIFEHPNHSKLLFNL